MKKIIIICAILVIVFLVGCEKKEEKNVTNNEQEVVITNNEEIVLEETEPAEYDENKKYFYLIDNDLFATVENKKIMNDSSSELTLSNLFENNEYYAYKDIFSCNERDTYKELEVAVYHDIFDKSIQQKKPYEYIKDSLNVEDVIREENGLDCISLGYSEKDVTVYSLPTRINQNGSDDAKKYLGVYDATINFERGFVTNDDGLLFAEAKITDTLSQKAIEYVTSYVSDNELKAAAYKITCYSLDLDNDSTNENVYLVESEISKTENGYLADEDEFARNNMISLVFIEDEGNIYSIYSGHTPLYSSQKSEFWDNLGEYIEKTKLAFADFDRDGNMEIIFVGEEIALEPFDVYQLYKYSDGKVEKLAELNGPNE